MKRSSSRFEHEKEELNKTYELTNLRNGKDLQPNSKNHLIKTQQLKKFGKEGKGKNGIKSKKQESPKKKDQGHHFRCLPKTVATVFNECIKKDETKMALVREMGFGAFEILPDYNLKQHMLKELVNIFDFRNNIIHSVHGEVEITTQKIGKALVFHGMVGDPFDTKVDEKTLSEEDLAVFKMFQGKHQADLKRVVLRTPVDTEANRILFKRVFLIFIQKCFLLATSSPNVTSRALPTLFRLETTRERNWALHVHDFLLEKVNKAKQNNTKAIHGCCYVLMIIYFHETHFGKNPREPETQLPWITYWTGENLRKRLHREQNHATGLVQTGKLRAGKERLERRNKELKMGVIRRKDTESSESESAEFDSEEGYNSEEFSSGGSSPDIDSENTMSEKMVQRRPLANPSPALQERRSKKRQEEPIDSGVQRNDESNIPQGTGVLGKRKQPERDAKAKR
ncbi:hypothetical protein PIB30_013232 [Stylosanthes scabra]|uniref:Uncharacterized protein n=1 Tax=Stylosanthes scabra TaxID=79078 RepID=A0ABU6R6V3_9FABA|nr:hypothetical protein [Stylosanthes scabra]